MYYDDLMSMRQTAECDSDALTSQGPIKALLEINTEYGPLHMSTVVATH